MRLIIKEDGAYEDERERIREERQRCKDLNVSYHFEQSEGRTPNQYKAGQPKKEIDWEVVKKLCIMQCTIEEIADFLDMTPDTLEAATKELWGVTPSVAFKPWRGTGRCSMRRKQWKLADTNASMAIWLGKQYLDQKDTYENNNNHIVFQVQQYSDKPIEPWKSKEEPSVDSNTDSELHP